MLRAFLVSGSLTILLMTSFASGQISRCAPFDLNGDTAVNKADLDLFLPCMTGPALNPPAQPCQGLDTDLDGDIDQDDFGAFQACFGHTALAVPPVISEFLASNHRGLKDDFNQYSDWIELYNPGAVAVPLEGWRLTDDDDVLDKWRFPAVTLPARGYLKVWASDRNLTDPAKPLHTNFMLDASGEYLALVTPDLQVVQAYAPEYPPQAADVSYGLEMAEQYSELIAPGASCRYYLPPSDYSVDWRALAHDDSSWTLGTTGIGYETETGYESLIATNVLGMYNANVNILLRIPFTVPDRTAFDKLYLLMKYDDGFIACLNTSTTVTSANAPSPVNYTSGATADRPDSAAVAAQLFDISTARLTRLRNGANVLAIHGLNYGAASPDMLIVPSLVAVNSSALTQPPAERYFTIPTPGSGNLGGTADLGPIIREVTHAPNVPTDDQDLLVMARVEPSLSSVDGVQLTYRVMYGAETTIAMADDGAHGDGAAGDGVYGAFIPASASAAGQMVRYYITAAGGATSRFPPPVPTAPLPSGDTTGAPLYAGTVVANPSLSSPLPILHWFAENPSAADSFSGARCSVFYNGEFYDNIHVHIRGNTSATWPKHHLKLAFNPGYHFKFDPDEKRVQEINLNSTYSDKSYIRMVLAAETYRDAGVPYSMSFPVRVQQNNAFYSVAVFVEEPDEDYLDRNDLDPNGAMYKMYTQLDSICTYDSEGCVEKQTRRNEDFADLSALVAGLKLTGDARKQYLFDNVNIPACINYIAATTLMHDNDHVQKNYYLYRDSDDTLEWRFLPWDKDLTFGRNYNGQEGVLNDTIWAANDTLPGVQPYVSPSHPLFGDSDHQKYDRLWNRLIDALNDTPEIREMHMRRLRTLMDELLQPPGTPADQLLYERRIDELYGLMQADVLLDRAVPKWAYRYGSSTQTFAQAIDILKTQYLAVRRTHLYNTHGPSGDGLIPDAQPADAVILFGTIEHSPASGIQDEEYIQLVNPNAYAVDVTGWKLRVNGKTKHKFHRGTVICAGGSLYATPKAAVFRARTVSPKGGEMLSVQGNYDHHVAPGETVSLLNTAGVEVAAVTIP